jgi:hypothetical protein
MACVTYVSIAVAMRLQRVNAQSPSSCRLLLLPLDPFFARSHSSLPDPSDLSACQQGASRSQICASASNVYSHDSLPLCPRHSHNHDHGHNPHMACCCA